MHEPSLDEMTFGQWVRYRRSALGLTQTEVAASAGMAQSNLAAIEAGRRGAGARTVKRLRTVLVARPSKLVERNRAAVLDGARRHHVTNVRVFGSVARGDDHPEASDVDLLVDLPEQDRAAAYIAFTVDVVSDNAKIGDKVLATAHAEAAALTARWEPRHRPGRLDPTARLEPELPFQPDDVTDEDHSAAGDDYFSEHGFRPNTRPYDAQQTRRRLSDVIEQACICAAIVSDGQEAFDADTFGALKTRMAAQRSIEILAEATAKLHSDYKERFRDVQWRNLYRMRTLAVHLSDKVRDDVIWSAISTYVPAMVALLGLPMEEGEQIFSRTTRRAREGTPESQPRARLSPMS